MGSIPLSEVKEAIETLSQVADSANQDKITTPRANVVYQQRVGISAGVPSAKQDDAPLRTRGAEHLTGAGGLARLRLFFHGGSLEF